VVKTVDKALRILDELRKSRKELSLSEISTLISVNKSTTYQILQTLVTHGFVFQNSTNSRYGLGLRILEYSNKILSSLDVKKIAHPYLETLRDQVKETVNLMIADNSSEHIKGIYVDIIQSSHTLRMVATLGTHEDLYISSVGKAILAFQEEEIINAVIAKGLSPRTKKTIIEKDSLLHELTKIKNQGFAIDDEEAEEGIRCIGAPIFDHTGKTIAGVSVAAAATRWDIHTCYSYSKVVVNTANEISIKLGRKV
jgi:IclR family acetate operon transcriptional repressor